MACLCCGNMMHVAHRCGQAQRGVDRAKERQAEELRGDSGHQAPESPVAKTASCAHELGALLGSVIPLIGGRVSITDRILQADACQGWHKSTKSLLLHLHLQHVCSFTSEDLTECGCHETCRHRRERSASAHAGCQRACQHQPHRPTQCQHTVVSIVR